MHNINRLVVRLCISKDELLRYYQGAAKQVYATDVEGKSVQFPVSILQKYVTHDGVNGLFSIEFSHSGKFVSIDKLR